MEGFHKMIWSQTASQLNIYSFTISGSNSMDQAVQDHCLCVDIDLVHRKIGLLLSSSIPPVYDMTSLSYKEDTLSNLNALLQLNVMAQWKCMFFRPMRLAEALN